MPETHQAAFWQWQKFSSGPKEASGNFFQQTRTERSTEDEMHSTWKNYQPIR
jgi:hypothetical protein